MEKMRILNKEDGKENNVVENFETCIFTRTEGSGFEYGFCLDNGGIVLDLKGNEVSETYYVRNYPISVPIDLDRLKVALAIVFGEESISFREEKE